MSSSDIAGKAMTVLGPVEPAALGKTLTHEHLLLDFKVVFREPDPPEDAPLAREPVTLSNLGWVRFNWVSSLDNLTLDDEPLAIREANHFKAAGGGTIVDVTSIGINRSPAALQRIATATGLNIVMGAGFYIEAAHPPEFGKMSLDEVTSMIVEDIEAGADGTGIRSGIIGELGCSWPWTEAEKKSVAAGVAAQRQTGAPLLIHPGRNDRAPLEILEFIQSEGGDMSRTIMGHIERTIFDPVILGETAATGAYLEYDLFGHDSPYYPLAPESHMPGDHERMDQIGRLISGGYLDRIVLAHDVCSKHRLREYGGHGYDHLLSRVVPWMMARGFEDRSIQTMLVDNPARILAFD